MKNGSHCEPSASGSRLDADHPKNGVLIPCRNTLTKRRRPIDRGYLYILLNNRTYIGEVVHRGPIFPGEHQPIIDRALGDKAHATLQVSPRTRAANTRGK